MKRLILLCVSALLLASCVSMQGDVYIDNVADSSEISAFENRFAQLDAKFFDEGVEKDKAFIKEAESLNADIENMLKDVSLKKAIVSRLYAIWGCLAFDMGNKGLAKKNYELSSESYKGDARTLILASRLGIEKNLTEKTRSFSDKSLLILELALIRYSEKKYSEAVAAFDEAFLALDDFYRLAYKKLRDKSWNLRNLSSDSNLSSSQLLALDRLTVMQMLLITNINPDLLFNYTAGKSLSEKDLFVKIAGSGLLNPVSQPLETDNAVSKDTSVTRLIAARFLWNLYNHRRNTPENLTKYSKAFQNKKRSPILDVKLDSPDFDAVLGCVENEIMHLDDGIEFASDREVSGIEFNESLGKLE